MLYTLLRLCLSNNYVYDYVYVIYVIWKYNKLLYIYR